MNVKTLGWQHTVIALVRQLINEVEPKVVEEMKWKKPSNPAGVPVWSYKGIICTGEVYKDKVKFTFMKGSALDGATNLFNAGNGVRRAIDLVEGDALDEPSFKALIKAAITLNSSSPKTNQ